MSKEWHEVASADEAEHADFMRMMERREKQARVERIEDGDDYDPPKSIGDGIAAAGGWLAFAILIGAAMLSGNLSFGAQINP